MGRKVNKRFYPTEEDPRYGCAFQVEDLQFITIDGDYTDWVGLCYLDERLISVGKNWSEWKKNKKRISDEFTTDANKMINPKVTPYRDVVAIKVHYLGDPEGSFQIL